MRAVASGMIRRWVWWERDLPPRGLGRGSSFHFAKTAFDELGERVHGGLGVVTDGFQCEFRTVSCPQRQQVEDAFSIDGVVPLADPHLGLELAGQLHEQVRGPRVEPLGVDDDDLAEGGDHNAECGIRNAE